jgi:hypothetical protein
MTEEASFTELILDAPPFSVNKAYYRNRQRTEECRRWGNNILTQLQDPRLRADLISLRDSYDALRHSFFIEITHFTPKLYTKAGTINKRSMDLSNIEKLLIDLIFDTRFQGRIINDMEINNLGIDDATILDMVSRKRYGPDYKILVRISLQNIKP